MTYTRDLERCIYSEFICYTDTRIDTFTWTDCIVKMTGILLLYTDGGPRQNVTELVSSETGTQIWNCDLRMVFSALTPVDGGGVRGRKQWQLFWEEAVERRNCRRSVCSHLPLNQGCVSQHRNNEINCLWQPQGGVSVWGGQLAVMLGTLHQGQGRRNRQRASELEREASLRHGLRG